MSDPAARVAERERSNVTGTFEPAFERVVDELEANVLERGETAAALCVYHRGRKVVDLVGGDYPLEAIQVTRSISKGVVAIVAHVLAQRGELDLDAPIADLWPEFATEGKGEITLRLVLSHRAGLVAIEEPLAPSDALRWTPAVEAIERQRPLWPPGEGHGYHDLAYGWTVGEVLRRATGEGVGALVRRELAEPLGLRMWIGLPLREMRGLVPLRYAPGSNRLNRLPTGASDSLAAVFKRAASNPDFYPWEHRPEYLAAEVPATNAVADARSVARLWAALIGEVDGIRLFDPETTEDACRVMSAGPDLVVGWDRRYSTGFMLTDPNRPMGGHETQSFGYYGQGGSLAFADPGADLAFAYLSLQEQLHLGVDPRTAVLGRTARDCAIDLDSHDTP